MSLCDVQLVNQSLNHRNSNGGPYERIHLEKPFALLIVIIDRKRGKEIRIGRVAGLSQKDMFIFINQIIRLLNIMDMFSNIVFLWKKNSKDYCDERNLFIMRNLFIIMMSRKIITRSLI